jgi:hypothetical protein
MVCQNYIILQLNIYVFSKAFLEYTPRTILIMFIYIYISLNKLPITNK